MVGVGIGVPGVARSSQPQAEIQNAVGVSEARTLRPPALLNPPAYLGPQDDGDSLALRATSQLNAAPNCIDANLRVFHALAGLHLVAERETVGGVGLDDVRDEFHVDRV